MPTTRQRRANQSSELASGALGRTPVVRTYTPQLAPAAYATARVALRLIAATADAPISGVLGHSLYKRYAGQRSRARLGARGTSPTSARGCVGRLASARGRRHGAPFSGASPLTRATDAHARDGAGGNGP